PRADDPVPAGASDRGLTSRGPRLGRPRPPASPSPHRTAPRTDPEGADMPRTARDEGGLVIGLGRFGAAIALTLEKLGTQVLAIDTDAELVQKYSGQLTHVVRADATQPEVLEQVGAGDFRIAVVGVGTSIESSVLIATNLV